jgi:LPXTG-motif cell wall-anchored protein
MKRLMIGTAALGLALGLNMAPAAAQNITPQCFSPEVNCVEEIRPAALAETVEVAPTQIVASQATGGQTLPVTGGDVVGLAAVGAAAVVGGTALLAVRRRRAEA